MLETLKHTFIHTTIDSVKLLPFLFIAFLIIELIEHKLSNKAKKTISSVGKLGPVAGSLLGSIPQCGFSVMATNLYVTRIISLGTLIAIYLSTSDEMIPVLIAGNAKPSLIIAIVLIKVLIGIVCGYLIDLIFRKKEKANYDICESDHCHCEKGIFASSVIHTLKIFIFILLVTFLVNFVFEYFEEGIVEKIFLKNSIFGPFISSLIGLIPNCGASVVITELYLNGAISFGSMIGGLLTGSGVALLVLFKSNKDKKENMLILSLVYGIGVISGIIIHILETII